MRADFQHLLEIPTRWHDNDAYGHVNNVDYYAFFDTVINEWLIREGGLDIHASETIGLCAESHCKFLASVSFPDTVEAGLRVGHLGNRSVRYEIELFIKGEEDPIADGWFVHVFVDREERKPREIPAGIRARGAAYRDGIAATPLLIEKHGWAQAVRRAG